MCIRDRDIDDAYFEKAASIYNAFFYALTIHKNELESLSESQFSHYSCLLYTSGLPEQPIERVSMKNVTITFDPNAEACQAAMADNRPLVKKLAIYAENVKEIDLHNVKIEGYEDVYKRQGVTHVFSKGSSVHAQGSLFGLLFTKIGRASCRERV